MTCTNYDLAFELLSEPYTLNSEGEVDEMDRYQLDNSGLKWCYGASKVVIVLDECVLKTSFSLQEIYEDECDDFEYEDLPDFAALEYRLYNRAREEGITKFFCQTSSLGFGVYEQEKIDFSASEYENGGIDIDVDEYCDYYGVEPYSGTTHQMKEYIKANGLDGIEEFIKMSALPYVLGAWSIPDLRKLYNFCKKYDINDIHNGNIGWVNGELKIFDFCGYHSEIKEGI